MQHFYFFSCHAVISSERRRKFRFPHSHFSEVGIIETRIARTCVRREESPVTYHELPLFCQQVAPFRATFSALALGLKDGPFRLSFFSRAGRGEKRNVMQSGPGAARCRPRRSDLLNKEWEINAMKRNINSSTRRQRFTWNELLAVIAIIAGGF